MIFLLVGLIAGLLAERITFGSGYGLPMDMALGVLGALLARVVLGLAGIAPTGIFGAVFLPLVGAEAVIWGGRVFRVVR